MLEELQALALSGATTLVGAMATDAWETARNRAAGLLGRHDPAQESALKAQLDNNSVLVSRAENTEQARQALVPMWHMQLEQLLQQERDTAGELTVLINDICAALPDSQKSWAQKVQNNIASNGGLVIAAQDGNVFMHQAATSRQPPNTSPEDFGGT
ncbi:hypothetical protein [Streptomyces sp. NPDC021212]|uniref:hypothetical protein n=1 Tax=Streptomyces sp. NPDC021212 TaxID=3365118 RepID=UPI0037A4E680